MELSGEQSLLVECTKSISGNAFYLRRGVAGVYWKEGRRRRIPPASDLTSAKRAGGVYYNSIVARPFHAHLAAFIAKPWPTIDYRL